jgi:hypothetical protein
MLPTFYATWLLATSALGLQRAVGAVRGLVYFRSFHTASALSGTSYGPFAGEKHVNVENLAKLPMDTCKNCEKNNWRVDVLWPNVTSAGYRAALARAERQA